VEVRAGYKLTEVGVIPCDWSEASLSSLIEKGSRITYGVVKPGSNDINGVLFVRGGDIFAGRINEAQLRRIPNSVSDQYKRTRLSGGEILISLVGYPGEAALVPQHLGGANIARQVALLRLNKNLPINPQFVCTFLQSDVGRRQLLKEAIGSAQQVINLRDIQKVAVALPPTEPEQRAIAASLNDVDALLVGLDQLIAKKRDLKQAAMQQLLTGQTRLLGFHGEWEVVEFGDIASIRNAKVIASSTPPGTQCVELDSIDGEGSGRLLMSTDATGMSSKYSFRKGDVLFGRLRAYLRKYWLATFDGICSTEIWPLIGRDSRLRSSFLHLLVQADDFLNAAGVSYGTHMPRSDWSVLKKLLVRLPRVPEQTAIAAVLSDMDAELLALEARRAKTRALKQAMMQELLTGRTRLV
jgi:type I restriction enzyme S subunit